MSAKLNPVTAILETIEPASAIMLPEPKSSRPRGEKSTINTETPRLPPSSKSSEAPFDYRSMYALFLSTRKSGTTYLSLSSSH